MILVAGSANVDFVVRTPSIPLAGETVLGERFETFAGGKGANQALSCAKSGAKVAFLGAMGSDPYAEMVLQSLQAGGVDTQYVQHVAEPTGAAFITVAASGENVITVASGANAALKPEHLPPLTGFTVLVLQLEIPMDTVQAYAQHAKVSGLTVVLNAAPAKVLPEPLLKHVDILVVNEHELRTIAGQKELVHNLNIMMKKVPVTIVTRGEKGCTVAEHEQFKDYPAQNINATDTTGAGDTFVGALVAMLPKGLDKAVQYAILASAYACEHQGAQASMPTVDQVKQRFASGFFDYP